AHPAREQAVRLEHLRGADRLVAAAGLGLVLPDHRLRVEPEGGRDRPDMPAGVEVTPARGEIVPLDPFDDRLADARALAELGHGQPGLLSRLRHHCANAHPSSAPCPSSRLARIRGAAWTWLDYAQYREVYPENGHSPRNSARSAGRSSGFSSTSRALEPEL